MVAFCASLAVQLNSVEVFERIMQFCFESRRYEFPICLKNRGSTPGFLGADKQQNAKVFNCQQQHDLKIVTKLGMVGKIIEKRTERRDPVGPYSARVVHSQLRIITFLYLTKMEQFKLKTYIHSDGSSIADLRLPPEKTREP